MLRELKSAVLIFLTLTVLTGVAYPLIVTAVAQGLFHSQANGSEIVVDGRSRGSALLGQPFSEPKYFWSRPSATSPRPNDGAASSGSNLGVLNDTLLKTVAARIQSLRATDPTNTRAVPIDLVTASASGLDPHISPAAAEYQAPRVARARGISDATVRMLVARATAGRTLGVLGEPRVNVLELNLSLDAQRPQ